jgi:uncharacterized protein YecT (DUF1311 family)
VFGCFSLDFSKRKGANSRHLWWGDPKNYLVQDAAPGGAGSDVRKESFLRVKINYEDTMPLRGTAPVRILTPVLLALFCMVGASLLHAAVPIDQETPCSSATTTAAMRECENLRYEKAHQDLDLAYTKLMNKLDSTGKEKLKAAQDAWLLFRQAEAEFEANGASGGTLYPLIKITVFADMTVARAAELRKIFAAMTG